MRYKSLSRGGWSERGEGSRSSEALEMEERLNAEYKKQLRTLTKRLKKKEEEKSAIFQQLLCERKEKKAIEEKHKRQAEKVSQLDAKQVTESSGCIHIILSEIRNSHFFQRNES